MSLKATSIGLGEDHKIPSQHLGLKRLQTCRTPEAPHPLLPEELQGTRHIFCPA